jgi:ubiquinone/menaquinone biosynthesis C-methylase UbiE
MYLETTIVDQQEKEVLNVAIKRFLMKGFVKLARKPRAKVSLERLGGFVVDIGGGGEGVIAKACGRETVCVDISKREIDEARSRGAVANWVLCDACSMPFRNGTFDIATFFFSLMYIKSTERKHAVMVETKRVLKSEGLLYLWDATIREKPNLSVIFVEANLPDEEKIYTGYGVKGKEKEQTLELISELALKSGLKVTRTEFHKNWFTACFH